MSTNATTQRESRLKGFEDTAENFTGRLNASRQTLRSALEAEALQVKAAAQTELSSAVWRLRNATSALETYVRLPWKVF